ncbi:DsbE family thiol:disulfide interchange protein [Zhongshania aliphaticivorans]|uniref:DsbE family thiol:disulfide interchange protein n=1 Tax=Zhongshania aliphaticivorans TaxID=1470434 RepID=UPI0012E4589D|nr:DsbE family thiol:disulfide interchange protein [Zhongshania aliphaticivorans]CAA0079893.1 Thiol:disulfide interchange protein DsbE [Zhongshania aliphaticivorans]
MQRLKLFLPLLVFALLAAVFFGVERRVQTGDYAPTDLPSALIDKPLPDFVEPALSDGRPINKSQIVGEIFLLNVWATWCPTCHFEHPFLLKLAAEGVKIVSIDYKDDADAAKRWLAEKGDPYFLTLFDEDGSLGLDLGVTGAPETYLVDAAGVVRFRYQGALEKKVWDKEFAPRIAGLNAKDSDQ